VGAKLERHKKLSLEEGLALIEGISKPDKRPLVHGVPCHTSSLRLFTFKTKGCECIECGIKAIFFAVECPFSKSPPDVPMVHHMNLYALDAEGKEVLMTHDHILARCLGGADKLDNTQPMCEHCNSKKGKLEHQKMIRNLGIASYRSGRMNKPKAMSEKAWIALISQLETEGIKKKPLSDAAAAGKARRNTRRKNRKRLEKESSMFAHIERGGVLEGSFETFTAHALYGHFSSAEVWERIQQHLVEKRGFPGGVVFGAKKSKPQGNPEGEESDTGSLAAVA
jgi:hypothetical protein